MEVTLRELIINLLNQLPAACEKNKVGNINLSILCDHEKVIQIINYVNEWGQLRSINNIVLIDCYDDNYKEWLNKDGAQYKNFETLIKRVPTILVFKNFEKIRIKPEYLENIIEHKSLLTGEHLSNIKYIINISDCLPTNNRIYIHHMLHEFTFKEEPKKILPVKEYISSLKPGVDYDENGYFTMKYKKVNSNNNKSNLFTSAKPGTVNLINLAVQISDKNDFSELFEKYLAESGLTMRDLLGLINDEENKALYKNLRGEAKAPTKRSTLFKIAIALKLNREQAEKLYNSAGLAFKKGIVLDETLKYCIDHQFYDRHEIDDTLIHYGDSAVFVDRYGEYYEVKNKKGTIYEE